MSNPHRASKYPNTKIKLHIAELTILQRECEEMGYVATAKHLKGAISDLMSAIDLWKMEVKENT